jgi:hypothetical protein
MKEVTAREFETIKTLLNAGVSISKTGEAINRSWTTVKLIMLSQDFKDYRHKTGELYRKYLEKHKPHKVILTNFPEKMIEIKKEEKPNGQTRNEQTDELIIAIREINKSIKSLVEAWEAKPKGFFGGRL